jgi:hypothetical protein
VDDIAAALEGLERRVWTLIDGAANPGRHAARSAILHIVRAFKLQGVDDEMALIRALTAEEEAARAIFFALRRRGYPGADQLRLKSHKHKHAVVPFVAAVGKLIAKVGVAKPQLQILRVDGKDTLRLLVELTLPDGRHIAFTPEPPLNFTLKLGNRLHDFAPEVAELTSEMNVATIQQYVGQLMAQRESLLYASDRGVARVKGDITNRLREHRGNVFSHLALFLVIDLFGQQLFVAQGLQAFLRVMAIIPDPDSEPGAA